MILILGELLVVFIIIITKIIFKYREKKKIDKILNFFEKKIETSKDQENLDKCKNILNIK